MLIKTIILSILLLPTSAFQDNLPIEKIGKELETVMFTKLYLGDLYTNDSTYYFGQMKVGINKESKVTDYTFSDNVPSLVRQEVSQYLKRHKHRLTTVDSLIKANKYANCSLVFPVRIAPTFIVKTISVDVIKDKGFQKFGGKYLEGRLFYGQTLYMGISAYRISKKEEF